MRQQSLSTQRFLKRVAEKNSTYIQKYAEILIPHNNILTKIEDKESFIICKELETYLCFRDRGGTIGHKINGNLFDPYNSCFYLRMSSELESETPIIDFGRFIESKISLDNYLHNLKCIKIYGFPYERVFMGNI